MNEKKVTSNWANIIIGVFMIILTSVSTYFIGNAKQDAEMAKIRTDVEVLKTERKNTELQINELIIQLKEFNENNQKLVIILAAKFGIIIE